MTQGKLEMKDVSVVHSQILLAISYILHCTSVLLVSVKEFVPVCDNDVFKLFCLEYFEFVPQFCINTVAVSHA